MKKRSMLIGLLGVLVSGLLSACGSLLPSEVDLSGSFLPGGTFAISKIITAQDLGLASLPLTTQAITVSGLTDQTVDDLDLDLKGQTGKSLKSIIGFDLGANRARVSKPTAGVYPDSFTINGISFDIVIKDELSGATRQVTVPTISYTEGVTFTRSASCDVTSSPCAYEISVAQGDDATELFIVDIADDAFQNLI
ncbi:MAG: hypothetical protein R2865_14225 [Deinococcales bacterium]